MIDRSNKDDETAFCIVESETMNNLPNRCFRVAVVAAFIVLLAAPTMGAQIGISTGPRPSRPRPDEPPKPKTIRGVVEDEQGKPLAGARIFIKDTKTNVTRTATADAKGLYEMKNLAPEVTYDVTAEFKGASEKKSVSGLLNRTENLVDFRLKVSANRNAATPSTTAAGPTIRTYDGVELRASLELPTGVPAPIPAVLLLHGYGEDQSVFSSLKVKLLAQGWAVMALDLRGHGESVRKNSESIKPAIDWRTSAHQFPPDIEPALDWLKTQPRIDSRKIAAIGYDIGANLALIASGRFPEVRTIVAVRPNLTESLAMAGSAVDFKPRSALVIVPSAGDEKQWKDSVAKPSRLLSGVNVEGGAAAWFDKAQIVEATLQWLKETF
jgi:pimeloyl-ACP methyl ester carboxylesterase